MAVLQLCSRRPIGREGIHGWGSGSGAGRIIREMWADLAPGSCLSLWLLPIMGCPAPT